MMHILPRCLWVDKRTIHDSILCASPVFGSAVTRLGDEFMDILASIVD